jgi:hypothetical protein
VQIRPKINRAAPGRRSGGTGQHRDAGSDGRLNRGSEQEKTYFRCDRYFSVGHEWYAMTREGRDLGPYASREAAELGLARHVTDCFLTSSGYTRKLDVHGKREPTVLEVLVQELAGCWEQYRLRNENSAYVWAQQRLQALDKHPAVFDRAPVRARALEFFLSELDA